RCEKKRTPSPHRTVHSNPTAHAPPSQFKAPRPHSPACLRQADIDSQGSEKRALARHVRAGNELHMTDATERKLVGDSSPYRNERMAEGVCGNFGSCAIAGRRGCLRSRPCVGRMEGGEGGEWRSG